MKRIILSSILFALVIPTYAGQTYKELSNEYNLVYREMLRNKIKRIPKQTTVKVFLKDGTRVYGTFIGFASYDDSFCIQPMNSKWGILSNEIYDLREIQDVSIIILRSI